MITGRIINYCSDGTSCRGRFCFVFYLYFQLLAVSLDAQLNLTCIRRQWRQQSFQRLPWDGFIPSETEAGVWGSRICFWCQDKMLNPQRSLSELPKTSTASQVERVVLVSSRHVYCTTAIRLANTALCDWMAGGVSHWHVCYCTELPTVAVSPEPVRACPAAARARAVMLPWHCGWRSVGPWQRLTDGHRETVTDRWARAFCLLLKTTDDKLDLNVFPGLPRCRAGLILLNT